MSVWPHMKALNMEESKDSEAFSFALASCLALSLLARYYPVLNHNSSPFPRPRECKGCFFSQFLWNHLSPNPWSMSRTWVLGKDECTRRWADKQAGREKNHFDFALISVSSPVMTDLTPVQYVLEIYLKGICDCLGYILSVD